MKYLRQHKNIAVFIAALLLSYLIMNLITNGITGNILQMPGQSRELYKKALSYQNNGDFKSAYNVYNSISSAYSAYDIVLLQSARCAASLEDEKTAINKLSTLAYGYNNSPIRPVALYNLGQAYMRTGKFNKAEKIFIDLTKKYKETNYAIASYYYLGEIYKDKNKADAVSHWIKYLELSPDGRFSSDCINEITSLRVYLSQNDKKILGIAIFMSQKYTEALKYFKEIPFSESWYYLAKIYSALGNKGSSLYCLKEGLSKYSAFVTKNQLQNAMLLYVAYRKKPPLQSWDDIIFWAKQAKDFAYYRKAQLVPSEYSADYYRAIVNYFPKGDFASDSLWKLLWAEYNKGNYSQAVNLGKHHESLFVNTKSSPKALFWTAKALEKTGSKHAAGEYYKKLLTLYPDSYYAFRAEGRLKFISYGIDTGWSVKKGSEIDRRNGSTEIPYSYGKIKKIYSQQAAEMIEAGDYDTARLLINKDPFLESWMKLKEGFISQSIVLARDGMSNLIPKPDWQDKRWKLIYPVYYSKEISRYSEINNLNSILILSLIREESYFNPLAVSSSNALGLMQLLPGTAGYISNRKNLGNYNKFQIFDPSINIMLGTAYFKYAKERLNDSSLYAVAGYNSGPGAVAKWMQVQSGYDTDQFIENIPYDQTRNYVKKIYGSYWNYKNIYGF